MIAGLLFQKKARTQTRAQGRLRHRDRLREIAGLVHVAAEEDGHVVGEELEWDDA